MCKVIGRQKSGQIEKIFTLLFLRPNTSKCVHNFHGSKINPLEAITAKKLSVYKQRYYQVHFQKKNRKNMAQTPTPIFSDSKYERFL
jgi:hypothetical protein